MNNDTTTHFYPCERIADTTDGDLGCIDRLVTYRMTAKDMATGADVPYLLDFAKVDRLWITDIYPEMWAGAPDKCRRLTSHTGININFQRISNTSVQVFLRDFPPNGDVMVISGSYQDGEDKTADSRRLRLYRYFFTKLQGMLGFGMTEAPGMNAFFIYHRDADIGERDLAAEYRTFKEQQ